MLDCMFFVNVIVYINIISERGEKMVYTKGFKFRIYPNAEQQKIINHTLGCTRFVYNHFLAVRRDSWQEKHECVTYVKSSRLLTELKCNPDFVWLKSMDSMALL